MTHRRVRAIKATLAEALQRTPTKTEVRRAKREWNRYHDAARLAAAARAGQRAPGPARGKVRTKGKRAPKDAPTLSPGEALLAKYLGPRGVMHQTDRTPPKRSTQRRTGE